MCNNKSLTGLTVRKLSLNFLMAILLIAGWVSTSQALPVQTMAPIIGEIQAITITTPGNVWSGGTMTIGGQIIILPANLLINLPNDYQSLQQLYTNAPAACAASGIGGAPETGLAKTDKCNGRATGAQATVLANRTDSGNIIAGQVDIFKALENVTGTVTYVDPTGYFRVNGILNDPTTGVMVRVNDPPVGPLPSAGGRSTVQSGLGCAPGNTLNCSPDIRFKVDPDNYTFCYITGYPACIPTSANDANCPASNRTPIPVINTSNPFASPPVAADSQHFAPVTVGDPIKADGSFETVGGVTFLSAWSVRVNVDLTTRITDAVGNPDPTQPNYLIINVADWDGPAYPAGRVRGRILVNSTDHAAEFDYFSIHYDPVNNAPHEQILYTTRFNKAFGVVVFNVVTGVSDSQIRYDFFPGAAGAPGGKATPGQEPCASLWGTEPKATGVPVIPGVNISTFCPTVTGLGIVDNFNLMVPIFREVMARSTRSETAGAVTGVAHDIHGRPSQSGFYKLPTSIAYGAFEDINLGMGQFPFQFSGNPFLLDRRLSPNGCVGACETTQQPLTPFPFETIDPRNVAPTYGFVVAGVPTTLPTPNRMLTFMTATGSMTGLLPWPPANAPPFPIVATAGLNMFPPFADEDSATTLKGVPVIINVTANDIAPFGTIDPASVKTIPAPVAPSVVATLPSGATVQVNPNGTITYTPSPIFSGADSFTYTVANNFGTVSLPGTVNVFVQVKPTAVNDTTIVSAKSAKTISLLANDLVGTSPISLTSVVIVSAPTCNGTPLTTLGGSLFNNLDGDVLFTAPLTVPAVAPNNTCTFSYTVSDFSTPLPLISNVATVTVTITPPVAPVAVNDSFPNATVPALITTGTPVILNVLTNDTVTSPALINPASLSVTAPTGAALPNTNSGTATPNANGTITYTPPPTPGTYTFTYTVKDNAATPNVSNIAIVTVAVTQGHIAPVAANITATTTGGSAITINTLTNVTATGTSAINPATLVLTTPTGGTAAANLNGTVTYTAPAAVGNYTFTYTMKDNFTTPATSNVATATVTVTAGTNPVAGNDTATVGAGLSSFINVLSNDSAVPGTLNPSSVILTAPTGAVTPNTNSGTAIVSNTGVVTYTAPPVAGTYAFTYTVKDNSVPPKISNSATVTVTVNAAAPLTGITLFANQLSPRAVGTTVTFGANVTGTGNYEYQFFACTAAGVCTLTQPYSSAATYAWNTTAVTPGNYLIAVQARTVGSSANFEAVNNTPYTIIAVPPPTAAVTIFPNTPSPRAVGTLVTFGATASGGSTNYEYQFFTCTAAAVCTLAQPYSTSPAFTWNTATFAPGSYLIAVQARNQGSVANFEAVSNTPYTITAVPPVAAAVTIFADKASPQLHGAQINFGASGSGGSGNYEYRFITCDGTGTTCTVAQDYSATSTFTWNTTPVVAGNYFVAAQVRNVGSIAAFEAVINMPYQIQ